MNIILCVSEWEWDVVTFDFVGEDVLLFVGAVLEELLDDVIAEDVRHETVGRVDDLPKHDLLLTRIRPLQLLLDESETGIHTTTTTTSQWLRATNAQTRGRKEPHINGGFKYATFIAQHLAAFSFPVFARDRV